MNDYQQKLIDALIESVEGGVCKTIDELLEDNDYPPTDELDKETLQLIDEAIFTCEGCGWTHTEDDKAESDDGDWCTECRIENGECDEDE